VFELRGYIDETGKERFDGERLVILIGGGTKKRQDNDIAAAQVC